MRAILILSLLCACGKSDKPVDKGTAADKGAAPHKSGARKVTEAQVQLNAIAKRAKIVLAETGKFPVGTAKALPANNADTKVAGGCCGGKSGNASVDNKCPVSNDWATDPVWNALEFSIDEPSSYVYKYESADGVSFTVTATCDLDCDGEEAVFTLKGTSAGGNASVELVQPKADVY